MNGVVDPMTSDLVRHRLHDITEEMGIKHMRTSGSPVLVGGYDASPGIATTDDELVWIGAYLITQAHVLGFIIRSVIDRPAAVSGDAVDEPALRNAAPASWASASRSDLLDMAGLQPSVEDARAGSVRDSDLVAIDGDETRCLRCGARLGPASDDVRIGCLAQEAAA